MHPDTITPACLGTWFQDAWTSFRRQPLRAVAAALWAGLPLAALARWSPPFGWMLTLVFGPVFLAGPLRFAGLAADGGIARLSAVLDPWYAPAVRRGLLTLGGFLSVLGIVAFGIQLSIIGGTALIVAGDAGGAASAPLLLARSGLLAVLVFAVAAGVAGWLFAIPLVVQRPLPALDAMAASFAVCRTNPGLVLALAGLFVLLLALSVATLGLAWLIGCPVYAAVLERATRELFGAAGADADPALSAS